MMIRIIFGEKYRSWIMQSPPIPNYIVPLRPKYLPQHPILLHPRPMFLPHYEQHSFTSIRKQQAKL
jgi:hypothetical protein